MEWKRVKTILIAVLLVTCLVLAANIWDQLRARRVMEEQAVRDACALAARSGLTIDPALVLDLPEYGTVMAAERDAALELSLAEALLGPCTAEEPGGGVVIYTGESGRLSIRRGGALELSRAQEGDAPDAAGWAALLSAAGLKLTADDAVREGETVVFVQRAADGGEILNCRLSCTAADGVLTVQGRWLPEGAADTGRRGASRAELVLALAELVRAQPEYGAVEAVTAGYELRAGTARRLELTPVWTVETGGGSLVLDTVTKTLMPGG